MNRTGLLISLMSIFCMIPVLSQAAEKTATESSVVIVTDLGKVKGIAKDGVVAFRGVPYAANPFESARRFQAPEKIKSWDGVLDATAYRPPVPQPSRGTPTKLFGAPGDLTLNIQAPEPTGQSKVKLPVMVWLPGGAFIRENASEEIYRGENFVRDGVVVVTVNYRVGVDGFMHIPGAPDNRGVLDQIAALEWVQAHIASYGGDPQQVTLAGQSAGAACVAILMGLPQSKGLFRSAILQSPPVQSITLSQAEQVSQAVAQQLGIQKMTVDRLSRVPYIDLVKAVVETGEKIKDRKKWGMMSWGGTAFLPVIDKKLIMGSPVHHLVRTADPSVSVLIGSTEQESRLYLVPSGEIDRIHMESPLQFVQDLKLDHTAMKLYKKDNPTVGDVFSALLSDYTFRMPAQHIAENLIERGNPVWVYDFAWQSPAFNHRLGAAHLVDVPFVFGTTQTPQAQSFIGTQPPASLSKAMHSQWVQFIRTGEAGWTPYQNNKRTVMRFDNHPVEVIDPDRERRLLWESYRF